MIQELQSYIENLENLAQQQKEEIHRVNEQNKVWKRQTKNPAVRSRLGEEFAGDGTEHRLACTEEDRTRDLASWKAVEGRRSGADARDRGPRSRAAGA